MVAHLREKKRVLFLTTSNRWSGEHGGEQPKSTQLAHAIARLVGTQVTVIDVSKLTIFPCEGNVSTARGNTCGLNEAALAGKEKNPSGQHRCWASLNNPTDELWKVSRELLASDAVVFFGSVRWGQMNSIYQKLLERLTWIENRHSSLGEENIVADIDAGIVAVGHNWRGKEVVSIQKEVLTFFGFRVPEALSWNWQFLDNAEDESDEHYREAAKEFSKAFLREET